MTDHANRETPGQYAACLCTGAVFFALMMAFVTQFSSARHDAPPNFTTPPAATIAESAFAQRVAAAGRTTGEVYTRAE